FGEDIGIVDSCVMPKPHPGFVLAHIGSPYVSWTGTRLPEKTGMPLRMSSDEVTIGCAMGLTLPSLDPLDSRRRTSAMTRARKRAALSGVAVDRAVIRHLVTVPITPLPIS